MSERKMQRDLDYITLPKRSDADVMILLLDEQQRTFEQRRVAQLNALEALPQSTRKKYATREY